MWQTFDRPFPHWVAADFLSAVEVRAINEAWPAEGSPGWRHENGRHTKKSSVLFPDRLPAPADAVASRLFAPPALAELSALVDLDLLPDPWFRQGGGRALGGGLHEIHPGGLLKMHLDFNRHPSGLTRCVNLLIYLNEGWKPEWGGELELHGEGEKRIVPSAGTAVMFRTTDSSWHGHPRPLACPPGRTRRSLALYFYKRAPDGSARDTTVYRSK